MDRSTEESGCSQFTWMTCNQDRKPNKICRRWFQTLKRGLLNQEWLEVAQRKIRSRFHKQNPILKIPWLPYYYRLHFPIARQTWWSVTNRQNIKISMMQYIASWGHLWNRTNTKVLYAVNHSSAHRIGHPFLANRILDVNGAPLPLDRSLYHWAFLEDVCGDLEMEWLLEAQYGSGSKYFNVRKEYPKISENNRAYRWIPFTRRKNGDSIQKLVNTSQ